MKTWRNLIVPVIILAALLGGFIFYSAVIKDRQNADQLESSETTFGDPTYDGSGVYCIADDSETVYTTNIEILTACSGTLLDFLDLSITDVAAEDVDSIRLNGWKTIFT